MTTPISRLVLAAVLLSSVPLAASAEGWGRDGDRPGGWSAPAPPPAAYPGSSDRARDPREWRAWRERREHRERERAEVSAQLRALDAQRDRFYAENRFRPGELRRYDRRYDRRRAELERRLDELRPVAWR